eukprot:768658-Hanusia_phi.AAC.5
MSCQEAAQHLEAPPARQLQSDPFHLPLTASSSPPCSSHPPPHSSPSSFLSSSLSPLCSVFRPPSSPSSSSSQKQIPQKRSCAGENRTRRSLKTADGCTIPVPPAQRARPCNTSHHHAVVADEKDVDGVLRGPAGQAGEELIRLDFPLRSISSPDVAGEVRT